MAEERKQPIRTGILEMLRNSTSVQYVIPAYQRNYTWKANVEVKKLLDDIDSVLVGKQSKHFLGIMIYLQQSSGMFRIECSVIDGQQRLTTIFLLLYALKQVMLDRGLKDDAESLENNFLINVTQKTDRYKLKPLVSDDVVYQRIVKQEYDEIEDKHSNVYLNFKYIKNWLENKLNYYSIADVFKGISNLYIVCIPIGIDDYPQKIFESINATGAKLTASDLIRNYILMPIPSEQQDEYYNKYWRKLESLISADSKKLESFFRFFIMAKRGTMVNKNATYAAFVEWFEAQQKSTSVENIFKEIVRYASYYSKIFNVDITSLPKELQKPIEEYRMIKSEMPIPLLLEYFSINDKDNTSKSGITNLQLATIIETLNSYLMRRSLCDMDTSSITRYFPSLLKETLKECDGNYSGLVSVFRKCLINENRGNAQEMPDDKKLAERIINANMYNIYNWVNMFFRKLESDNNKAPVDFSKLSIEHLMPQTPTVQWLAALDTDRPTYEENVNRLGNLTFAAKSDNSKMSNNSWQYKKQILSSTSHLKLNQDLLQKDSWTLQDIDNRTKKLIDDIKRLYPYYAVKDEAMEKIPIFLSKQDRTLARAYFFPDNGSVKVLAGSIVDKNESMDNKYVDVAKQRTELLEDGIIEDIGDTYVFAHDHLFTSNRGTALSNTASLILHGSRNGKEYWETEDGNPIYMLINKE